MPETVIIGEGVSKRFRGERPPPGVPSWLWLRARGPGTEGALDDDDEDDAEEEEEEEEAGAEPGPAWALREVDLRVQRGAALAVVGASGSGKTTLIRILSRLTLPTTGRVTVRGRVVPLSGAASSLVRGEKTGRANAHLLARFYGVPADVVDRNIDAIAAFADIGPLLDRPLREYSSRTRQHFTAAVALHLEADVLLADDKLVTGDRDFRERSLERICDARRNGATLVFSSNDLAMVDRVASHLLWLEDGRVRAEGPADLVLPAYRAAVG